MDFDTAITGHSLCTTQGTARCAHTHTCPAFQSLSLTRRAPAWRRGHTRLLIFPALYFRAGNLSPQLNSGQFSMSNTFADPV